MEYKLLSEINNRPNLSCKSVDISLIKGNINLGRLTISEVHKNNKLTTSAIKNVEIKNLHYIDYLLTKKIVIHHVILSDVIASTSDSALQPLEKKEPKKQQQNITLLIKKISLQNGRYAMKTKQTNAQLDSISLQLSDFLYSKNKLSWKKNYAAIHHFLLDIKTRQHTLSVKKIELTTDNVLTIKNILWKQKKPTQNEQIKRNAQIDITIPEIKSYKFEVQKLITNQQLLAKKIIIKDAVLKVFIDKNKDKSEVKNKLYFYEKLAQANLNVHFDTIQIKNQTISYEILPKNEQQPASLHWYNLYSNIYALSNTPGKAKPYMQVDISSKFMDNNLLNLHFRIPTISTHKPYSFSGSLDRLNLTKLNSFSSILKRFEFKKGELTQLQFKGTGNLLSSSGTLNIGYQNIEIALMNNDKSIKKGLSILLNKVLINNKKSYNRAGKMYVTRDSTKLFLPNWWNCIQSGLKSSILPNVLLTDELKTTD